MERKSVLEAVRDQSKLVLSEENGKWTPRQWFECFHFLFVDSPFSAHSLHQDDLLFFVRAGSQQLDEPALLVRRKAKQLPQELSPDGCEFNSVDWTQTVQLNLVLQSQYQLTVVACGPESLPLVAEGRIGADSVKSVTKPVYASTSVTAVNMDNSRASASKPQPCYPDICFAIDSFDDSVEDLVLEHEGQCYCVVLQAVLDLHCSAAAGQQTNLGMEAAAAADLGGGSSSLGQAVCTVGDGGAGGNSWAGSSPSVAQPSVCKRTLFAGFVSYGQILQFMDSSTGGRSLLGALLRFKGSQEKDKVVMMGPDGVGRCEVAVTKAKQQQPAYNANGSSSAQAGGDASKAGPCSMLCALMLLKLPAQYVALELLEAL